MISMMNWLPLRLAMWTTGVAIGSYTAFLALLMVPWLQRFALYANKFHTAWLHSPDTPKYWGFAEKQITPYRITTPDGVSLYAWHILPLNMYYDKQESLLAATKEHLTNFTKGHIAFDLLRKPNCRVIIYFHGNAGCVSDGWRPDYYKAVNSCDPKNTHIITFDYRGFGLSTSNPSESGLIIDGISILNWIMMEARVPAEKILLVGHSLGTAIAVAVAEHFVSSSQATTFAGLVLVSGFSDIPTLMKTYAIGGIFPILSPLTRLPRLQNFISTNIVDTWDTAGRLKRLAALSWAINFEIIHAANDWEIGSEHADLLYDAAISGITGRASNATSATAHTQDELVMVRALKFPGRKCVRRTVVPFGGHNKVLLDERVVRMIHAAFEHRCEVTE